MVSHLTLGTIPRSDCPQVEGVEDYLKRLFIKSIEESEGCHAIFHPVYLPYEFERVER